MNTLTLKTAASWIGWAIVISAGIYYMVNNIPHYFVSAETLENFTFWARNSGLLLHILSGIIALSLGPFQFIKRIRSQYLNIHRITGRVYVISVLVGSLAAFYLATTSGGSFAYRVGLGGLAFVWISSTAMAYVFIRQGNITQHREWMIRSYVVTCGFTTFRLVYDLMVTYNISTFPERATVVSWACWAFPLFITEMILQSRKKA